MALCLIVGGSVAAKLAGVVAFSLVWTHSVEKTQWEEDWRIGPQGLVLTEARVAGHGAGMEPPPGARLEGGFWRWRPNVPVVTEVVLRRSGATADWSLCTAGTCRAFDALIPADADPVTLAGCAE